MKKIILAATVLLATSMTYAQSRYSSPSTTTYSSSYTPSSYSSSNSLTALLGFRSTAAIFGVTYENQGYGTLGVGGYFLLASEKEDIATQVTSFGVIAPMHLLDDSRVSVYIAPGFGIHMLKGPGGPNSEDVTTFGPALKTGALFKISHTVKVGAEYTQLFNWFSDKAGSEVSFMTAALNFAL